MTMIIILTLVTCFILYYILSPLLQDENREFTNDILTLLDRKQHYIQLLKDLELDLTTGKIEINAYNSQKQEFSSNLAEILNSIELTTNA